METLPLLPTATLLNIFSPGTLNIGFDGSQATFTTGFLKSQGFLVDGTGNVTAQSLTLASSFTQNDSVGWAMSNGPWLASLVNAKGPSLTGQFDAMSFTIQDDTHVSSGGLVGLNIAMNVAPNGNSASGGKIAFSATLDEIGTSQGGTITSSGIASGGVINAWSSSNTGGASSNYIGALNGLNCTMELKSGATFKDGGTGLEVDTTAATGSSYDAIEQVLISTLSNHAVAGRLNANAGILFTGASGAIADTMDMIRVGGQGSAYPGHPFGRIFYAGATQGYTLTSQVSASAFDVANNTFKSFTFRAPFKQDVVLQASGITSATRLTSDLGPASSFIYDALFSGGTGFTTNPTIAVTGGTGASVMARIDANGFPQKIGVANAGTGVPSNATASVSGGGGTGMTVALRIAGNTLNFPVNSAVDISGRLVFRSSTSGDAICWSIEFGATQGATPGTTAIVGSPTWTQVWATGSAAAHIAISTPTADTTLGAINITVTPSAETWTGGGTFSVNKSVQI